MSTQYLEDLIYKFLSQTLSDEEKRHLTSGYDAERYIDEETAYEMKDALFYYMKSRVLWSSIISKLHDEAEESEDEKEDHSSCCSDDD